MNACPFRYQGQYEDAETGLYYNRFRYYSPDEGMYISQDSIGLNGGHTLYSYVHDLNTWVDRFGLAGTCEEDEKSQRGAKRDADIPMGQQPSKVEKVMMTDSDHNPILDENKQITMTTEYHYTNNANQYLKN